MKDAMEVLIVAIADAMSLDPAELKSTDTFSRLGGDSLSALIVVEHLYEAALVLDPVKLFEENTLEEIASAVSVRT